jgi:hypothetical protein
MAALGLYKSKENEPDYLGLEEKRDRVKDAGMFKGKPEDNGVKSPEMKYNPDDYLPENQNYLKQNSQPQTKPQEQSATEQPVEQAANKQDEYAIDKDNALGSIFDIEVSSAPEYDEKRQKVRKNQAVLGTLGNALTSMGDGLTLGMGGHVIDRNFDDNEKYINDFVGYRDDYQKRLESWDNQRFLQELKKAGEISDAEYKDEANRIREKGVDSLDNYRQGQLELGKQRNETDAEYKKRIADARDASVAGLNEKRKNDTAIDWKQLEMQQKKLAEEMGDNPVEYTVNTGVGTSVKKLTPNQAQENFVRAMSNPEFMKWAAKTGLVEKDTKGGGTDDVGRPIEGETNYSIERGIKPIDIAIAYDKYKTSKDTGSDIDWTGEDYQTAGKPSQKETGQTVGDEIVNSAINGGADNYTTDRLMNSNNSRFKSNNQRQAEEKMRKQLKEEGLSDDGSASFIEAMKNGDVSSIVNLDDKDREQMGRMLQRLENGEDPERVQAGIETLLMSNKGFTPSQAKVIAMDFIEKGLPETTQQLPSEKERLNVLP